MLSSIVPILESTLGTESTEESSSGYSSFPWCPITPLDTELLSDPDNSRLLDSNPDSASLKNDRNINSVIFYYNSF